MKGNREKLQRVNLKEDYKECIVCFIDISGYSNFVKVIEQAQDMIDAIVDIVNNTTSNIEKVHGQFGQKPFNINIVSDSIVVTAEYQKDPSAENDWWSVFTPIMSVIYASSKIQAEYLERGFLVKGGLCLGRIYRDNNMVFGEALAEAVKMESENRKPCIIVANTVVDLLISSLEILKIPFNPEILGRLFRKDENESSTYLHYLMINAYYYQQLHEYPEDDGTSGLKRHQEGLIEAINRNKNGMN